MRRTLWVLALSMLGGCSTSVWREGAASPRLFSELTQSHNAHVTLRDGRKEHIDGPRDFGDALCSQFVCVYKADIVSARYYTSELDLMGTLMAAPLVPVVVVGAAVLCATGCDYGSAVAGNYSAPDGTAPTQAQLDRIWLDTVVIINGKVIDARRVNPCASDPAFPKDFATDNAAIAWAITNRRSLGADCINSLQIRLWDLDRDAKTPTFREALMRIQALQAVRARWHRERCAGSPTYRSDRVGPTREFDLEKGKGDPRQLEIIAETLTDPETYSYDRDLDLRCETPKPRETWPDPIAWGQARSPFAVNPYPDMP